MFMAGVNLFFAFHHKSADRYPGVMVIDMVADNAVPAEWWKTETARRFPNAIMVFCHGGELMGQWAMKPENGQPVEFVADLARKLHEEFPTRPIVLICCNPGHHTLNIPHVYHALDDVWMRPDKDGNPFITMFPHAVGNIWEFTDDLHDDR